MMYIFAAYVLDLILGDPRWMPHPVRGIGWLIRTAEKYLRKNFRNLRIAGVLLAVFVIGAAYLAAKFIIWDFGLIHPGLKTIASIILIYFAISIKDMKGRAEKINEHLEKSDIEGAREQVSHIVGRDTRELDSEQIVRATVESVAESTVDGIISILFYAFVGGPVLVWVYKAINTLDSMIGHKNIYYREIGWFSARLDDIFNYIPARISAIIIPIASYTLRKGFLNSLKTVVADGNKNPSPNSGVPEAAFAGALRVQLGGLNYYGGIPVHKPYIGQSYNTLRRKHIKEAVELMYVSSAVTVAGMIIINWVWNFL